MMSCGRPLLEVASSCELSPLATLTAQEGNTLVLGRFDQIGTAAMAAAAASNVIDIADGKDLDCTGVLFVCWTDGVTYILYMFASCGVPGGSFAMI